MIIHILCELISPQPLAMFCAFGLPLSLDLGALVCPLPFPEGNQGSCQSYASFWFHIHALCAESWPVISSVPRIPFIKHSCFPYLARKWLPTCCCLLSHRMRMLKSRNSTYRIARPISMTDGAAVVRIQVLTITCFGNYNTPYTSLSTA